jgi:hypothetical protein
MDTLSDRLRILEVPNAAALASGLFRECFNQDFPVPRDNCGLSIPTPPENWHQFVAIYRWPDSTEETVGFCNWIRYRDVYLEGGMCVQRAFYRRLPRDHWKECSERGGLAQMMMQAAAARLNDCTAWFGFVGDKKALAADLRAGYQLTNHDKLIVKWFAPIPEDERGALIDSIAAIGPF